MADCGATGSALDQAARVLTGQSNAGSKVVLSNVLVGNHALSSSTMPVSAPQHLPPLIASNSTAATAPQQQWSVQQQQQQPIYGRPQEAYAQHHQQQQHHHTTMMQQPQQQQMMPSWNAMHQQMHQQNAMMHQMMLHQQQVMQQKQGETVKTPEQQQQLDEAAPAATIAELSEAWKQATAGGDPHDAAATPVSMEELAEAWRQAQEDATTGYATLDDAWAAEDFLQDQFQFTEPETYEFRNKVESTEQTEQRPDTTKNWMEEGMRQFEQGDIAPALKAFEYELQLNNTHSSAAWRMLGRCHAESDMDRDAILCLEQAVDRDPYSVEARLALGVSYVNELDHGRALEHLKAWITHHPQLAGLDVSDAADIYGVGGGTTSTPTATAAFDDVQQLLLRALDYAGAEQQGVVVDILEALGVVYNVSRDYGAAVDALRKACQQRPADYQLWNKLGATLANSNQSEQALPSYHQALQIKPKYARAWLNLAISHSNLEQYDDAARCYLQTLSLNPNALHCWSYLRIAISCAERWDLIPLVAAQDLVGLHQHFDFELYENAAASAATAT